MRCYIKNKATFVTRKGGNHEAADYNICLASIYNENSIISITGETPAEIDDFIYCENGFLGVISAVDGDAEKTLTAKNIVTLFERELFSVTPTAGIENFIKTQIEVNFKNCSDSVYAKPFLSVTTLTNTNETLSPDFDDNGLWDLTSYIAKARRVKNIFVDFSLAGNTLEITIAARTPPMRKLDFNDSTHTLLSNSFSIGSTAKISTYCAETEEYADWYLKTDGTISASVPASNRAEGAWKLMTVNTADELANKVADEFAKNSHSHLIEFSSEKTFGFFDRLLIKIANTIYSTYISAITDDDGEITYQSGELRTKFTDKNKEMM